MSKFTPGPWLLQPHSRTRKSAFVVSEFHNKALPTRIAAIYTDKSRFFVGESDSNARLIAAAPAMYEALRNAAMNATIIPDPSMSGATDTYSVPLDDIEAIRAALASIATP